MDIPPPMPLPAFDEMQEELKKNETTETADDSSSDHVETDAQKVEQAAAQKSEGLEAFMRQDFDDAISKWSDAAHTLRGVTSVEGKSLLQSIHANLSLCHLKKEDWTECITECSNVLKTDPDNVKALYRRSKAYLSGPKNGENAKDDLIKLIRKEPGNVEYRRMYEEAQTLAQKQKEERKNTYSGLFSKHGLYDDREQERERKAKEAEEVKEKRRIQFEDEMAKRASEGKDVCDFETWEKEESEKKEAERKAREEARAASKKAPAVVEKEDSEEDYTEEERKILAETKKKGYCYFKNSELTPEERAMKQKINKNAPTKLEDEPKPWTPDQAGIGSGLSSWNSAGTSYEEKNMTKWAKDCLKGLLLGVVDAPVCAGSLTFTEIAQFDGEANAAVVRGTNRYFYDLDLKIKFTFQPTDESATESTGELFIQPSNVTTSSDPDCPEWLQESRIIWRSKNVPTEDAQAIYNKCNETVLCLVKGFEESFGALILAK